MGLAACSKGESKATREVAPDQASAPAAVASSAAPRPSATSAPSAPAEATAQPAGPALPCDTPAVAEGRHRTELPMAKPKVLEVVERGAEPRRALRYAFQPGILQTATFDLAGRERSFAAIVRCRDGRHALVQLEDFHGRVFFDQTFLRLSPRGEVLQAFVDLEAPPRRPPETGKSVVFVLPQSPVGVGAVLEHVSRADPAVVETTRYTVTKIAPSRVDLTIHVGQSRNAAAPETRKLAEVKGRIEIDLRAPLFVERRHVTFEGDLSPSDTAVKVVTEDQCQRACVEEGRCHPEKGRCGLRRGDCQFSRACLEDDRCSLSFDGCVAAGDAKPLGGTDATEESDRQRRLIQKYLDDQARKE